MEKVCAAFIYDTDSTCFKGIFTSPENAKEIIHKKFPEDKWICKEDFISPPNLEYEQYIKLVFSSKGQYNITFTVHIVFIDLDKEVWINI